MVLFDVVVVYHVAIVAIGHGLSKTFWPLVIGRVLRTAGSSIIRNYADPLTSLELLNYYLNMAMINCNVDVNKCLQNYNFLHKCAWYSF